MTPVDTVTVALRGTPALRRPWYGELARLVASGPPSTAVLFECSVGDVCDPILRVTVRPAEVVDLLRRSGVGASLRVDERPGPAPAPWDRLVHERWGDLVRGASARGLSVGPGGSSIDRVGIVPGIGPDAWLGLQTFWLPARRGTLWLARRFRFATRSPSELKRRYASLGIAVAAEWSLRVGMPATFRNGSFGVRRDWRKGGTRALPPDGWFERPFEVAARSIVSVEAEGTFGPERPVETPAIVLGASGAGKTTYLARWAAEVMNRGGSLVAVDLHGDLGPAILDRLTPESQRRVVAVDATLAPVPGIAALASGPSRERSAAHLVAALKRLTPDGTDLYWGFRLERVFDTFVRLALESEGSLTDLYDLLTNPDRRDAARLATRSVETARFLDELGPVVRRNPEFLFSAATRLSKVMLVPALRELLAPDDGGLPVESLLSEGRSVLVRLPFASLGPEAAAFAATLVLGRVYLGVAASAEPAECPEPVSLVLDEVQAFSPRLVSEILTEGRKFGLRVVVATQYPDRLAPELRAAARGALRGFVTFRVPRPAVGEVGAWFGLGPVDAADRLPNLPTGQGLVLDPNSEGVRPTAPEVDLVASDPQAWNGAVEATRREFDVRAPTVPDGYDSDAATERLLLAVLARTESGATLRRDGLVDAAAALPGARVDPALLIDRLSTLFRDGYVSEVEGFLRLTPAGERRLGLSAPTEATRETAEHRALLMAAFRLVARRGYRLEILRQGRFDTTLPDARLRQLPERSREGVPADLGREIEHARRGWAWRFFSGHDVHFEAEVSGALRPERVRHGVRKALRRGAFVVFLVGDAHRARRVRSVVRAMGLGPDRAQVWTLPLPARSAVRPPTTSR